MKYECPICKHVFTQKSNYETHIKRKRPCQPLNTDIVANRFTHFEQELTRMKDIIVKLEERCATLERNKRKEGTEAASVTVTNTTKTSSGNVSNVNNVVNSNVSNNVYLCNFGSDDTSFLTLKDLKEVARCDYNDIILKYIEKVNCNKDVPQNHNLLISNLRADYAHVYKGGKWTTVLKQNAIEEFIGIKKDQLADLEKGEVATGLSGVLRDSILSAVDNDNEDDIKRCPKQVEQLMYSYRDIIKETKKQTESKR